MTKNPPKILTAARTIAKNPKIPDEEKNGIDFKFNNKIMTYKPKPFDLIIFPNYLDHRPHGSETDKKRISINIELQCKEKAEDIFYGI